LKRKKKILYIFFFDLSLKNSIWISKEKIKKIFKKKREKKREKKEKKKKEKNYAQIFY
jgi:hypothetical protein